jgi:hypothetical protein
VTSGKTVDSSDRDGERAPPGTASALSPIRGKEGRKGETPPAIRIGSGGVRAAPEKERKDWIFRMEKMEFSSSAGWLAGGAARRESVG